MSKSEIGFARDCPDGHPVRPMLTPDMWRESLDTGTAGYWCVTCNQQRELSPAEQARLRQRIDKPGSPPQDNELKSCSFEGCDGVMIYRSEADPPVRSGFQGQDGDAVLGTGPQPGWTCSRKNHHFEAVEPN